MKKGIKRSVIAILIIVIVGIIAYPKIKPLLSSSGEGKGGGKGGQGQGRGGGGRSLNVNAVVIQQQELSDKIISTGTLIAEDEVDLTFEASGKIVRIDFTEGSRVQKGQVLAKVNDLQLQAQLQKLDAQKKLAEERLFRQKALLEKDAISREAYDQAATEIETLNADIALVKAKIAETELKAPFDGHIGLRYVSEGAYVTPSVKVAKLTKINPLKVSFTVPGRYAADIKKGAPVRFDVDGRVFNASIYAVESKVDIGTNTLPVRAIYPNKNDELTPGLYASVELTLSTIHNAIAVPSEALISEMGISKVFLYKNGKAESTPVTTGMRTESQVQILKGLNVGDTLIASGILQLRSGMPITLDVVK